MVVLGVILFVMLVLSIILAIATAGSDFDDAPAFWMGVFAATVVISIVTMTIDPYKDGQIDALSGNVKYELRKTPNGEMKWEKKYQQIEKDTVIVRDTVFVPIK